MTDRNARPLQTVPMFQPPADAADRRFIGVDLASGPDRTAVVVRGRQGGKTLEAELAMRAAIEAGHDVLEHRDGRFIGVRLGPAGELLRDTPAD